MTDDQAREALLELAQEAGRTVGAVGTLPDLDRLHVFSEEEFDDMRSRE